VPCQTLNELSCLNENPIKPTTNNTTDMKKWGKRRCDMINHNQSWLEFAVFLGKHTLESKIETEWLSSSEVMMKSSFHENVLWLRCCWHCVPGGGMLGAPAYIVNKRRPKHKTKFKWEPYLLIKYQRDVR
jgi:hypothetical protein